MNDRLGVEPPKVSAEITSEWLRNMYHLPEIKRADKSVCQKSLPEQRELNLEDDYKKTLQKHIDEQLGKK